MTRLSFLYIYIYRKYKDWGSTFGFSIIFVNRLVGLNQPNHLCFCILKSAVCIGYLGVWDEEPGKLCSFEKSHNFLLTMLFRKMHHFKIWKFNISRRIGLFLKSWILANQIKFYKSDMIPEIPEIAYYTIFYDELNLHLIIKYFLTTKKIFTQKNLSKSLILL